MVKHLDGLQNLAIQYMMDWLYPQVAAGTAPIDAPNAHMG